MILLSRRLCTLTGPLAQRPSSRCMLSYVPSPTWSIDSLKLGEQHTPVSPERLQKLSKRALIDTSLLNQKEKDELCQDLGNLLQMIEKVTTASDQLLEYKDCDPSILYDIPRGVTEAPTRGDIPKVDDTFRPLIAPKLTTRHGGHQYFEIATDRSTSGNNKR